LQTLLGYPAVKSGEAVTPRGLGSLASMIIVGRLVRWVDSRLLIATGFTILAGSTWALGRLNLDIAMSDVIWPNIISGLAMGFIFVPLTTAAMGSLPTPKIGSATGIYNLMRNLGGSVGIAAATTLLARGAQIHQAALAHNLTPYDAEYQRRLAEIAGAMAARVGPGNATEQAERVIYAMVQRQAMLLAFLDTFRLIAVLCLLCVPLVLLFRKVQPGRAPAGVH
jgi:DHA2 family multidrug resistance protein